MTPADPAPDLCWLCSKPLEPTTEPTERICTHCQALNRPPPGATPVAVEEANGPPTCRLCLQAITVDAENPRGVCSNCGEVNVPNAPGAPSAMAAVEPDQPTLTDEAAIRLYGSTLGVTPAGAALALWSMFAFNTRHPTDSAIFAPFFFVFFSIAAFMALIWKRASSGPSLGPLLSRSMLKAWGLSLLAFIVLEGVLVLVTTLLFKRHF